MRGDALQGLKQQKLAEGKDLVEVNDEINHLVYSQIEFKQCKKEIKHLTKDNEKLLDQNDKLKRKVFDLQLKADSTKGEPSIKESKESDIKILKKTMLMLKNQEQLTVEELAGRCLTPIRKMEECLGFLSVYGIVTSNKKGERRYYI